MRERKRERHKALLSDRKIERDRNTARGIEQASGQGRDIHTHKERERENKREIEGERERERNTNR